MFGNWIKKISANSIQDHCKYWDTSSGAQLKGFGTLRPSSLDVCTQPVLVTCMQVKACHVDTC